MNTMTHVEQIFDRAVRVVEAGTQGTHNLLTLETHLYHVLDCRL